MLDSPSNAPPRPDRIEARARRSLALMVGLLGFAACPGCASYRPTQSGYLSDYSGLVKDPIHLNRGLGLQRAKSHNASTEAMGQVDSYYIEPVQWLVSEQSRASRDPNRRDQLTALLHDALRDELCQLGPVVDQPGPRTARVRSAITNVRLSHPLINIALIPTWITPIKVGPMFNGGGYVEAEVIGPDGRQISGVSCASSGGPIDILGFYTRMRHAKQAMRRAAEELRETLGPVPGTVTGS